MNDFELEAQKQLELAQAAYEERLWRRSQELEAAVEKLRPVARIVTRTEAEAGTRLLHCWVELENGVKGWLAGPDGTRTVFLDGDALPSGVCDETVMVQVSPYEHVKGQGLRIVRAAFRFSDEGNW